MNKHLLIVGLLVLGLPLAAGAWTTNYVDVGRSGLSLNTGTNWANAYTNLGDALNVSWTNDLVWVAAGTYYPTLGTDRAATFYVRQQVALYGGFTNGGSMADRNWTVNRTVLSGDIGLPGVNTDNCYNVVLTTNNYMTIDGFTIRDGYNPNVDPAVTGYGRTNYGAGIVCYFGLPSNIVNCTFFNNAAYYCGGAIYLNNNWAANAIVISNCLFVGNSVKSFGGGALGMQKFNSVIVITHCGFYDNWNYNTGGGNGGAVLLHGGTRASENCTLKQCRFVGNRGAGTGLGGALYYTAQSYGGASWACRFTTRNCLFAGNTAPNGGAIAFTEDYIYHNYVTENCTFAGNYGTKGGAAYLNVASVCLTNNILWDNVSLNNTGGDGMFITSAGTAYVSYVCSQGGLVFPAVSNAGVMYDQGGNITGDPSFATNLYAGTWKADAVYSSNTAQTVLTDTLAAWPVNGLAGYVVNPHTGDRSAGNNSLMFQIVTNNATALTVWGNAASLGTNTSSYVINDYHFPANSSCVNKGTNQDWMTGAVDLDGKTRLRYGAVDMGAYECIYKGTIFGFR